MDDCPKTSSQLVEKSQKIVSFRPGKMFKTNFRLKQALRFKLSMLILVFIFICLFADNKAKGDERKRILVINSYHPTYVWTKEMIKGIESTLADHDPSIELYIEYMDTKRLKTKELYEDFYNLYKHKSVRYAATGRRPDVIIACDDAALFFINQHKDEFINEPIVFCGINNSYENISPLLKKYHSMTGILETNNYRTTLQMALKFHPSAKQVVVIHNEKSPLYNMYKTELRDATRQLSDRVKFINFSMWEISKDEALKTIESLGDESIVLLLSGLLWPRGDLYPLPEGIETLQKRCSAPIYTTSHEWIRLDMAVGGDVTSAFHQGKAAVEMAIRILNGEKPNDIPVMKKGSSVFTFSYPQMTRFGIPPSKLPKGAILLNRPESFYRKYHTQIYTISLIVAGLSAATILLSVNIIRRIKAEQELQKALDELELRVHKRTAELAEANIELRSENYKRKRAEENLAKERNLLRTLVDNIPDFVYIKDAESRFILNNKAHLRAIGVKSQDELTGKTDLDVFPKHLASGYYADEREIIQSGKALVNREEMFKDAEGKNLWVLATKVPLRDGSGKITTLVGISRDITERKEAMESLQKSESRFQQIAENAQETIWETDVNGLYTYVSPTIEKILGYRPDEIVGKKHFYDLFHPEDKQDLKKKAFEVFGQKQSFREFLNQNLHKNGKQIWLSTSGVPVFDNKGDLLGYRGTDTNITERKRATDALQKHREQLKSTLESTADGILAADENQKVIYFNTHFTKMWHIPQDLVETRDDKKLLDFVLDQLTEPQVFLSKVYQLYASYEDSFDTLFFKDGRVFERFSCPLIQDGKLVGRVWSFRNVTKRKQTEQKILEYQKDLQSLASELSLAEERLRHQIAVNVHDDIGQPLAISKIKMESLASLLSSAEYTQIIKEVLELTNQAIENTRSLSFELSPPVLYELGFEAAIEWLARRTKESDGLSVKFVDDKKSKPLNDTVRVFLFQAVRELLVNIVKHASAKNVKVSVRKADHQIHVAVEDDGRGFDVSKVKSRDYKTRGFGLFSIQERLKYIGGHIDIDSAPKQGTRITLAAPIDTKKSKEEGK